MQTNIARRTRGFFFAFFARTKRTWSSRHARLGMAQKNNASFFLRLLASRVSNTPRWLCAWLHSPQKSEQKRLFCRLKPIQSHKKETGWTYTCWQLEWNLIKSKRAWSNMRHLRVNRQYINPGGGTRVFFGRVCAARDSKLAPSSKKNFP